MMSISQLTLLLRSPWTSQDSSASLERQTGKDTFEVQWLGKGKNPNDSFYAEIEANHWEPRKLDIVYSDGTRASIPLENQDHTFRWAVVRRFISQKSSAKRGTIHLPVKTTYYREKKYGREVERVRGNLTFHDATREVVTKYHDHSNAVLILPDSWLDNKLQEAYSSKRGEAEEE